MSVCMSLRIIEFDYKYKQILQSIFEKYTSAVQVVLRRTRYPSVAKDADRIPIRSWKNPLKVLRENFLRSQSRLFSFCMN